MHTLCVAGVWAGQPGVRFRRRADRHGVRLLERVVARRQQWCRRRLPRQQQDGGRLAATHGVPLALHILRLKVQCGDWFPGQQQDPRSLADTQGVLLAFILESDRVVSLQSLVMNTNSLLPSGSRDERSLLCTVSCQHALESALINLGGSRCGALWASWAVSGWLMPCGATQSAGLSCFKT